MAGVSCRLVLAGAVSGAVVEDDAVIVVGDLGLANELDWPVDAAIADRPGTGIVQADHPGPGSPGLQRTAAGAAATRTIQ
jgi:hypothetical protein